ncbi:MAG: response regulator [Leptospirales bacterium]|jgi:putative two-component system response regulator
MENRTHSVLIVDDEPTNLRILEAVLSPIYRVYAARSGPDAIRIVQDQNPDAILLDVMMPEMNGYEVCRTLRLEPKYRALPVIFVTARGDVPDEEDAFHAGATDYITKPIDPDQLLARLRMHLK